TGTASGKTLCYNIPVVEALLDDPMATALYIYPTKALAQDQLRGLSTLETDEMSEWFMAGTYDGDTPGNLRRRLRDGGNVILTNPDMLHQGILPHHARWNRFFTHLRYVVIDEVHAYRGVFGSHLANVMRRLHRICRHYGAEPQFVCCSATIGNPREHAERVVGAQMELVDEDGAPRGPRRFVLWNPRPLSTAAHGSGRNWRVGGDRRSALSEAIDLMTELVREEVQTIAFVRTRLAAELLFKGVRDRLRPISRRLSQAVHAYRGGYLPVERREIERRLVEREILGVASTSALELGIDIGSLDACILVGYPGTVASTWQMSGRAGRGEEEALVFLVGQNTPMDQYLMAHSDYLFEQSPEQAVVDPDNPHITIGHLRCAAHELPLSEAEAPGFGPYSDVVLELLEEDRQVRHSAGHWYHASSDYPAAEVNLRNISGPVYTIQDERDGERVIGTLDEVSAFSQLHDHAVYLHGAETYFVEHLDIDQKIAHVDRRDLDYYTQSVQSSKIRIDETEDERSWRDGLVGFGDVTVTTEIPMFKKIKFASRDSLGWEKLEMPPQTLETVAMWFAPPPEVVEELMRQEMIVGEALIGIANVFVEVAPLYVMADVQDLGTVVDSSNLGRDALFVHDRYPGGMGFAARCMERFDDIMRTVAQVIDECGCEDGCPSCVGAAVPPFAATDMDSAVRGRIPDRAAAQALLQRMIEDAASPVNGR
ncbi:MAG: DEAD/DEAH box helicase, partial [Armatimonadota bacterium]